MIQKRFIGVYPKLLIGILKSDTLTEEPLSEIDQKVVNGFKKWIWDILTYILLVVVIIYVYYNQLSLKHQIEDCWRTCGSTKPAFNNFSYNFSNLMNGSSEK